MKGSWLKAACGNLENLCFLFNRVYLEAPKRKPGLEVEVGFGLSHPAAFSTIAVCLMHPISASVLLGAHMAKPMLWG